MSFTIYSLFVVFKSVQLFSMLHARQAVPKVVLVCAHSASKQLWWCLANLLKQGRDVCLRTQLERKTTS